MNKLRLVYGGLETCPRSPLCSYWNGQEREVRKVCSCTHWRFVPSTTTLLGPVPSKSFPCSRGSPRKLRKGLHRRLDSDRPTRPKTTGLYYRPLPPREFKRPHRRLLRPIQIRVHLTLNFPHSFATLVSVFPDEENGFVLNEEKVSETPHPESVKERGGLDTGKRPVEKPTDE